MNELNDNIGIRNIITEQYYNFTSAEKKCAEYINTNLSKVQYMSISELAEACQVAEATISRFARKNGFKNFNDLKVSIAQSAATEGRDMNMLSGEVTEKDSFSDVCQKLYSADTGAIAQTLELINEEDVKAAADLIEKSEMVVCMGQGGSMVVADEAAHLFTTIGCKYFSVSDSHTQAIKAATMSGNDLILFFSYSGATVEAMQTLKIAKERGVKVVLITRYPKSPATEFADVVLLCGTTESPLQLGSAAAKIAQIFLLDVLFSELCLRNLDECRENRKLIANALADKHIKSSSENNFQKVLTRENLFSIMNEENNGTTR